LDEIRRECVSKDENTRTKKNKGLMWRWKEEEER